MKLIIFILFSHSLFAASNFGHEKASKMPALERVNREIEFRDDLHFEHMLKAISRQEDYFKRRSLNHSFNFAGKKITRAHLYKSLKTFRSHVVATLNCFQLLSSSECYKSFNEKMNRDFAVYRPKPLSWERGYKTKQTLFTAYYSPDLEGSVTKTDVYKNPIYAMPQSEYLRSKTSDEINYQGALKGKGLELFYVKESLYDIWLLHVQGGGRVKVRQKNGMYKKYYLSYAGSNKQKFRMLFRYMVDQGMLTRSGAGVPYQRAYFEANPSDQRAILASCPSFIFFKVTKDEPLGVHNIPLTENRSIATDYRRVQEYGIINFITAVKPDASQGGQKAPFSRFFINQDTGGAIKGNARVDMYFGYGKDAERAAYSVHNLGEQYYLILK